MYTVMAIILLVWFNSMSNGVWKAEIMIKLFLNIVQNQNWILIKMGKAYKQMVMIIYISQGRSWDVGAEVGTILLLNLMSN